jgi:hypothetical protein
MKLVKLTFGAEHELANWDALRELPIGFKRSPDITVVNDNGVAAQPNVKVYRYGGEINTPPTSKIQGQVDLLHYIKERYPEATVNHRSNLHLHIRWPGLKENLAMLKQIQLYIHTELPKVIGKLEPIPAGKTPAEQKRAKRRKISHQMFLTPQRLKHQLAAKSVQEFFEREVPRSKKGQPMWHAQPRLCVGLRQLLQTDTVEFRHFPGTLVEAELRTSFEWCLRFLEAAVNQEPIIPLWESFATKRFPVFPAFDEEREIRYRATAAGSGLKGSEIRRNIALILKGQFNAQQAPEAYRKAQESAGALPRQYQS